MVVYRVLRQVPDALFPSLTEVYRQAYGTPPYSKGEEEVIEFSCSFPDYLQRKDFRMLLAEVEGVVIGFAFGFRSAPEYFWYQVVSSYLSRQEIALWLDDAFQLAEIALLPAYQGQGIGGELHDRLLEGQPHRTAVLTTMLADSNAYGMYMRRGWQVLVERFTPPRMSRVYRMMGLRLEKAVKGGR